MPHAKIIKYIHLVSRRKIEQKTILKSGMVNDGRSRPKGRRRDGPLIMNPDEEKRQLRNCQEKNKRMIEIQNILIAMLVI
jgi:hypothetical protein